MDRIMAFWHYDQFPFYLWGEVMSFSKSGKAYIREYRDFVNYEFILPYSQGERLVSHFDRLAKAKSEAIAIIEDLYARKVEYIIKSTLDKK